MAKTKIDGGRKVPNRHIYARLSYLQQATHLLYSQHSETRSAKSSVDSVDEATKKPQDCTTNNEEPITSMLKFTPIGMPLTYELGAQIRSIAQKSVIRLSSDITRSICKRCSAALIDGSTSISRIENKSHNGRKPWADVLVITCMSCQMEKRFPVGRPRNVKKPGASKKDDKNASIGKPAG